MAGEDGWSIIVPEATTNLIINPSFETGTSGWSLTDSDGSVTESRSTEQQFAGAYSYKMVQTDAGDSDYISETVSCDSSTAYTFSFWAYTSVFTAQASSNRFLYINDGSTTTTKAHTTTTGKWERYSQTITTGGSASTLTLRIYAPQGTVYIDAIQVEQKSYVTTYCDGDQQGCNWLGVEHGSTSRRDVLEYSGGRERGLYDYFSFVVNAEEGTGMPPHKINTDNSAVNYGSTVNSNAVDAKEREFTIGGYFTSDSTGTAYHAARKKLVQALNPVYGGIGDSAPVRLINDRSGTARYIDAFYQGGLDYNGSGGLLYEENVQIRFLAPDPLFYALNESGTALNDGTTGTHTGLIYRDNENAWDDFNSPSSASITNIYDVKVFKNGDIIVGGDFQNFDGDASLDYFARYNASSNDYDGVFSSAPNGRVHALLPTDEDGAFWIGGNFTSIQGTSTQRIAYWNGSSLTAYASSGITDFVKDIKINNAGTVFVTIDNTQGLYYLNSGTWTQFAGLDAGELESVVFDAADNIYVSGAGFSTIGGDSATSVAYYDGSSWTSLCSGAGFNNTVYLLLTSDNALYAYGAFTSIDGVSITRIAFWTGTQWAELGGGANAVVNDAVEYNGEIHFVGSFTEVGTNSGDPLTVNKYAIWTGTEWKKPDITGLPEVRRLGTNGVGGIALGLNASSSITSGELTSVSYSGTARTFPRVKVTRSGGTSATLSFVENELTGDQANLNIVIRDGETIELDARTNVVTSNLPYAGAAIADTAGEVALIPSRNENALINSYTTLIETAGSPTLTTLLLWRDSYLSVD